MKRLDALSRPSLVISALLLLTAPLSEALSIWTPTKQISRDDNTRLQARQASASASTATPTAINIPPSQYWEGNDGPWSTFPLQVGSGSAGGLQNVRLMVSTAATGIVTIAGEGCPDNYVTDCPNARGNLFLRNQSLSWTPNSLYQVGIEMNLGLDTSGYLGYDTATLGWQGSGVTPTDEHSIIWNIADSKYWVGLFGVNPRPTNLTTFTDPQPGFLQTLRNRSQIPSLSYGYTAGNQYRSNNVYGSLVLGGYDSSRFIANNVTFPFYTDITRDLSVWLQSVTTDKGSPSNLLPDDSISILIDSTVPELWLPESACTAFEQAFGIEYNTNYNRYIITSSQRDQLLSQDAQVTFTIGPSSSGGETVDIVLPYKAFDLQVQFPIVENPNTSYYFPLQRAANDTQYTLGRTFLQEAYLIADYERLNFSVSACNWDENELSSQKIESVASPNDITAGTSTTLSTGALVGVVVGGVLFLVAIVGFAIFCIRRRKAKQRREQAEFEAKQAEAEVSSASIRNLISNPIGGELGGGDLHEMSSTQQVRELADSRTQQGGYGYNEMDSYHVAAKEMDGFHVAAEEMDGGQIYYEMPGSEPHEMSGRTSRGPKI